MVCTKKERGFTLIELMLALAFISFILVFAITTIIQVMRTYNKGLAVKDINQTARASLEDMSRYIRTTTPSKIKAVSQGGGNAGRTCLGGVSYVWNEQNQNINRYTDNSRVIFARVNDLGGALCDNSSGSYPNINKAEATELLRPSVWVQFVKITPEVGSALVGIDIQLSIADDVANPSLEYSGENAICKPGSQGEFCAVANFKTTVVARGGE